MRECKCRVLKRNEDQWKKSGIKLECIQEYSYQSFTPHSDVSKHMKIKSIEYANNFFDIEKMRSNSLVFMGQVGSGKTHLTIAIAAKLMKEGVDVAYFQYREATMDIKQNIMDTDTYKAKMDFYKGIRLLLLDDLFKKTKGDMQITKADINIIYDIINHRYVNHLPTIITTELLPEELLNVDEATGSRIIEMAQDYMIVITDKHCNYRLKKFI
ncbi:ATP-binding protein [Clostridium sp. C8-1-8]|uniref:ATP-binding protein n=1 Tax=Clostridium sp. C8-1-8 TaxID=2698831 RepID=UPI00136A2EED|nr:ATP-binding protein [Clostridium sp. C8-1-8]